MTPDFSDFMQEHGDAVDDRHRFSGISLEGVPWDLSHLDPFGFRVEISEGLLVDVIVFFACHCFTHEIKDDPRSRIPPSHLFTDDRETRVLSPERFRLSRLFLPGMIRDLPDRQVRVQAARGNYFTLEATDSDGVAVHYAVFFEVEKDRRRKKRLLLRVQSAFPIEVVNKRMSAARKVRFNVLLRAAYEGRLIKG